MSRHPTPVLITEAFVIVVSVGKSKVVPCCLARRCDDLRWKRLVLGMPRLFTAGVMSGAPMPDLIQHARS
jgi:hypothetical protein